MPQHGHAEPTPVFESRYKAWLADGAPAPGQKPPLVWVELNACSGDSIALANTQKPSLAQVLERLVELRFSNTLLPAQGERALDSLFRTADRDAGRFILVVEGAVPLAADGLYAVAALTERRRLTARDIVQEVGPKARYVVAAGTCACYGGPSAAYPNLSGSVGLQDVLKRRVINVAGCPVNPDWIVGTLFQLVFHGEPALGRAGRPLLFYRDRVHTHCQRRSYYDRRMFASKLGDPQCMFLLGCSGPRTHSDCPYRQWNGYVNWPVRANTPCIGCTTKRFPDRSMPFFAPLSFKRKGPPGPPAGPKPRRNPHSGEGG